MVRSQRYFEVIDEEELVDNAATVGAYFVGELQRFAEEFPNLVSNVRGRGLMAAFDLPSGETPRRRAQVVHGQRRDGALLRPPLRALPSAPEPLDGRSRGRHQADGEGAAGTGVSAHVAQNSCLAAGMRGSR